MTGAFRFRRQPTAFARATNRLGGLAQWFGAVVRAEVWADALHHCPGHRILSDDLNVRCVPELRGQRFGLRVGCRPTASPTRHEDRRPVDRWPHAPQTPGMNLRDCRARMTGLSCSRPSGVIAPSAHREQRSPWVCRLSPASGYGPPVQGRLPDRAATLSQTGGPRAETSASAPLRRKARLSATAQRGAASGQCRNGKGSG